VIRNHLEKFIGLNIRAFYTCHGQNECLICLQRSNNLSGRTPSGVRLKTVAFDSWGLLQQLRRAVVKIPGQHAEQVF
jgi:hypothetical protein